MPAQRIEVARLSLPIAPYLLPAPQEVRAAANAAAPVSAESAAWHFRQSAHLLAAIFAAPKAVSVEIRHQPCLQETQLPAAITILDVPYANWGINE